jgi:hypothetical protein
MLSLRKMCGKMQNSTKTYAHSKSVSNFDDWDEDFRQRVEQMRKEMTVRRAYSEIHDGFKCDWDLHDPKARRVRLSDVLLNQMEQVKKDLFPIRKTKTKE